MSNIRIDCDNFQVDLISMHIIHHKLEINAYGSFNFDMSLIFGVVILCIINSKT